MYCYCSIDIKTVLHMRNFLLNVLLVCFGLFCLTYYFEVESLYYWFGISALVLLLFLIVAELIIRWMKKDEPNVQSGNYVYWDYDSEPGCWAHNDSLSSLMIYRTDKTRLTDEQDTDDGWSIVSKVDSEPEGACLENEETTEIRKNGITIKYIFSWKKNYTWLLQHDIVRMLFDKKFFNEVLANAENGDADAQTLIGCCYGHNGKMSNAFIDHDEKKAVEWWNKASEQGHKYATRELALYYWHKNDREKARELNRKGDLNIFAISYGTKDYNKNKLSDENDSK